MSPRTLSSFGKRGTYICPTSCFTRLSTLPLFPSDDQSISLFCLKIPIRFRLVSRNEFPSMVHKDEETSRVIRFILVPQERLAKGTFAQHPGVKRRGKPPHLHRTQVQVSAAQATLRSALSRVLSGIPVGRVAGEPRIMTITSKEYSHAVRRSTFDVQRSNVQLR
jgi:hypothetical protein